MKWFFKIGVLFPIFAIGQSNEVSTRNINSLVSLGVYTPFVKSTTYFFTSKDPNGAPSPIFNPKTKMYVNTKSNAGYLINIEGFIKIMDKLYGSISGDYIRMYNQGQATSDSIITYKGDILKKVTWEGYEEKAYVTTAVEYRVQSWLFFQFGLIHTVYSSSRTEFLTAELKEKSSLWKRWDLTFFEGQYLEASFRIPKLKRFYIQGKLLHMDRHIFSWYKNDFSYTVGLKVFLF